MKGFVRHDQLLSLCGLNCGLCSMHLGGHCPGCGGGAGNQPCKIARCSKEHGDVPYCFQCEEFPCEQYEGIDRFDSFITHRNQRTDLAKASAIGLDAYHEEQREKQRILEVLLADYNDGRKKTLFCLAANLLEVCELQRVLADLQKRSDGEGLSPKERGALAANLLKQTAAKRGIELKLRKRPK